MAKIQPPKGTRDLYPLEAARRRWLCERWRAVAIRHGFEEVDGPTFETTDLYAVKSGEGILGELFQAFSGKDPREVEQIREGRPAPYALRPEFTPTLARMYAQKARTLPAPCRWFQIGPFFRAERPQRGRLREFLQWNVDLLGDASERADAEIIACCIAFLESCGLTSEQCTVRVCDRDVLAEVLEEVGLRDERAQEAALRVLDKRGKVPPDVLHRLASEAGFDIEQFDALCIKRSRSADVQGRFADLDPHWIRWDWSIVRGLAYYTGTVFEVVADGERAVAGGGRYDNLIELFGGPPTPAVGFAMGDVVISLLLQDKGLMPDEKELLDEIGARPDAFVLSADPALDDRVNSVLRDLRHAGLHARRTSRQTRNVGKLLKEASQQHAKAAVILESLEEASVKWLDAAGKQERVPIAELVAYLLSHARSDGSGPRA